MSDLRTAAQQALEALEYAQQDRECPSTTRQAIAALRAALAQQAEPVQEPAYKVKVTSRWHDTEPLAPAFSLPDGEHLLYTAPPQRKQAEPLNLRDPAVQKRLAAQWGYVPAAAQAEPVEPVAWECKAGGLKPLTQRQYDAQTAATKRHYTRIAPPQHEALQNTKHYEAPPGFVLNPDYLVPELRAQRDALLEALKVAEPYLRHADVDYNVYVQCRAAIALVEGRVKAVEEGK